MFSSLFPTRGCQQGVKAPTSLCHAATGSSRSQEGRVRREGSSLGGCHPRLTWLPPRLWEPPGRHLRSRLGPSLAHSPEGSHGIAEPHPLAFPEQRSGACRPHRPLWVWQEAAYRDTAGREKLLNKRRWKFRGLSSRWDLIADFVC